MSSKILKCLCAIAVLFYLTQLPATALASHPRSQPLPSTHSTLSPSEAYYVATDGSDTLGDGSSAHPWLMVIQIQDLDDHQPRSAQRPR